MSTSLAIVPVSDRDRLAARVVERVAGLSVKLRELEDDIRRLWEEFYTLPQGETILGCATRGEFCEKHLHRTPRAIQYMLNGRTRIKDVRPAGYGQQCDGVPTTDDANNVRITTDQDNDNTPRPPTRAEAWVISEPQVNSALARAYDQISVLVGNEYNNQGSLEDSIGHLLGKLEKGARIKKEYVQGTSITRGYQYEKIVQGLIKISALADRYARELIAAQDAAFAATPCSERVK